MIHALWLLPAFMIGVVFTLIYMRFLATPPETTEEPPRTSDGEKLPTPLF